MTERLAARARKDFERATAINDELVTLGVVVDNDGNWQPSGGEFISLHEYLTRHTFQSIIEDCVHASAASANVNSASASGGGSGAKAVIDPEEKARKERLKRVSAMLVERYNARNDKDYATCDRLRDELQRTATLARFRSHCRSSSAHVHTLPLPPRQSRVIISRSTLNM